MCQLLGMNCNTPTDIVFSFSGFATRACEHADGFGIAFFEGRGLRLFVDHEAASVSPVAELIKRYPIKSRHVIAHIRKATQGQVTLENCHPFVRELWGSYWAFAHNGNLVDFHPKLHAAFRPVGDTDSERAFCWLMQELAKSHASMPSVQELTATLSELVPQVARHGTFNFMLSQGEALWAHCSTKLHYLVRQHPFGMARLQDQDVAVNFAELAGSDDRVAVVATEPLTLNEPWTAMSHGELMAFVGGTPAAVTHGARAYSALP
ncbi:MAG: class II glutamine amidotransferase [Burkholderiales bacterium]|nr:MAG: class II glutamine amidotransferase [Burkholderiales bacterium]